VTKPQKIIIALLSAFALLVLVSLGCATAYWLFLPSAADSGPAIAAAAQAPSPTPIPSPTSTPAAAATPAPTATSQPSSTPTRVVTLTVQPTPTPTLANCLDDISNFGASGLITDQEVQQYLAQTLPLDHLDGCRAIEYFHQPGSIHGTPIAGSIIPIYREIQVFAVDTQYQTSEQILDTVTHEIGHNVHKNIRANNFDLDNQWAVLYAQSQDSFARDGFGFVSGYAQTNKFEDFAETYLTYVRDPDLLRLYNLSKYDYMRVNVFIGREYGP